MTQNEILRLMELGDIWGRLEGSWVGVEEDVISFILSWEDVQVWNKWRMKIKWVVGKPRSYGRWVWQYAACVYISMNKLSHGLLSVMLCTDAEATCDPKCRYEVRKWKHGAYTLVHDTDLTACEFALDAIFFCCCKGLFFAVHTYLLYGYNCRVTGHYLCCIFSCLRHLLQGSHWPGKSGNFVGWSGKNSMYYQIEELLLWYCFRPEPW